MYEKNMDLLYNQMQTNADKIVELEKNSTDDYARIKSYESKVNSLEEKLNRISNLREPSVIPPSMRNSTMMSNNNNTFSQIMSNSKPPLFRDIDLDRPIRYLKGLKNFIDVTRTEDESVNNKS